MRKYRPNFEKIAENACRFGVVLFAVGVAQIFADGVNVVPALITCGAGIFITILGTLEEQK